MTLVVNTMEVLVVRTDTPIKSASELVALAKSRPDGIAMASTGVGSPPHLALELFKGASGANVLHVRIAAPRPPSPTWSAGKCTRCSPTCRC